jgi:hypothetical protein
VYIAGDFRAAVVDFSHGAKGSSTTASARLFLISASQQKFKATPAEARPTDATEQEPCD